ncbi:MULTISPECIES: MIP/aquaporin family protein [unclassified Spirosoma]|uniref:MIP/aquaporin family protein n=1 Tax=unclassified Spirosoma TaxID=2621999 RepID=UPI00095A3DD1|nr:MULTISPECIES: MIP/aquaporin family protein [unclassified Spirosoma]MBN8824822.1 aquaporin family protein [Spirosoma sp.]OJW77029.1 MAG: aquaporin [Spirosoma sp. 48-14]
MHTSPFLGELIGTMVLLLLGNGVVANVVLKQTKGESAGWIVITAGWAFAVTMGVFVAKAFGSIDAHLNPAVTVAFAVATNDFSHLVPYITAQMIGAFLGTTLVWLHYLPHWAATPDPGDKLACFSTGPAIRSTGANFLSEALGTLVLILGLAGISSKNLGELAIGVGPYLVGILVWSIGLSLGGTTGYAINPARDLGPRLAHAILPISGKGSSDWGYAWIPVVGPIVGAIIGGLLIRGFAL